MRSRATAAALMLALTGGLIPASAVATPVATTQEQRELLGRTFLQPRESVDYIQFGRDATGTSEFVDGMKLLEKLYPRYLTFTTIHKELGDRNAVSTGGDGLPPWHPDDTGDGRPFHVAILTDKRVPDRHKEYVGLLASHQLEPCGREGILRTIEDILIWAKGRNRVIDDARGTTGRRGRLTATELLGKAKIYFISVNPDGWARGDRLAGAYSQNTERGTNSNRIAYQTGWVFPPKPIFRSSGYSVLTEPEGVAPTVYLRDVRQKEIDGRPFAAAVDIHGPVPFGYVFLHDQGNDPVKLLAAEDLAARIEQNMDEVQRRYITRPGAEAYERAVGLVDFLTRDARRAYPLQWSTYGHIWETFNYTVSGSWGGWMNSRAGLDSVSLSFEINCRPGPWEPAEQQLFQDNVRSMVQTVAVWGGRGGRYDVPGQTLGKRIGFLETGERVTDRDGNPSPPPRGHPGHPLIPQIKQTPYDVSNTDYFRHLNTVLSDEVRAVHEHDLSSALGTIEALAVADAKTGQTDALRAFVKGGGTLVLTDSALRMLPSLLEVSGKRLDVKRDFGYVGYADLRDDHWLTVGLHEWARQTYDPIGLGYPVLMERDAYWPANRASPTRNSAPLWSIDRAAFEKAKGTTVGTIDPPEDRKSETEGRGTERTSIGVVKLDRGRIVFFGALLPQPTERNPHWFGLDPYTISIHGQEMLLRALSGPERS